VCQYGQGVVRGLFEEFKNDRLRGVVIWIPILPKDSQQAAEAEACDFTDSRISHLWDVNRRLAGAFAGTLGLQTPAWDVYLLFDAGAEWIGNDPPQPAYWMAQLPEQAGAEGERLLQPARVAEELRMRLNQQETEPKADLALRLHAAGLAAVHANRSAKAAVEKEV
jgi:hypothetical protein